MIETERLILRQWQDSDYAPFAQLNADAEVMRYFPAVLTRLESDTMLNRLANLIDKNGWGFWAVEVKQTKQLIGFVGLHANNNTNMPHTPFVEIGWRLARTHWGNGYAFEAANRCLDYAFHLLELDTVYSLTAIQNEPSWRLMEKLGLHNTNQNFDHPSVSKGHDLERHYLYKMTRTDYLEKNK